MSSTNTLSGNPGIQEKPLAASVKDATVAVATTAKLACYTAQQLAQLGCYIANGLSNNKDSLIQVQNTVRQYINSFGDDFKNYLDIVNLKQTVMSVSKCLDGSNHLFRQVEEASGILQENLEALEANREAIAAAKAKAASSTNKTSQSDTTDQSKTETESEESVESFASKLLPAEDSKDPMNQLLLAFMTSPSSEDVALLNLFTELGACLVPERALSTAFFGVFAYAKRLFDGFEDSADLIVVKTISEIVSSDDRCSIIYNDFSEEVVKSGICIVASLFYYSYALCNALQSNPHFLTSKNKGTPVEAILFTKRGDLGFQGHSKDPVVKSLVLNSIEFHTGGKESFKKVFYTLLENLFAPNFGLSGSINSGA